MSNVRPQMSSPDTPSSSLLRCPRCNELVAERNMKRHTNKVHNPEVEAKRQLEAQRLVSARFLEKHRLKEDARLRQEIGCPVCRAKFQLRDVKAHFGNVHSLELTPFHGHLNLMKLGVQDESQPQPQATVS